MVPVAPAELGLEQRVALAEEELRNVLAEAPNSNNHINQHIPHAARALVRAHDVLRGGGGAAVAHGGAGGGNDV